MSEKYHLIQYSQGFPQGVKDSVLPMFSRLKHGYDFIIAAGWWLTVQVNSVISRLPGMDFDVGKHLDEDRTRLE